MLGAGFMTDLVHDDGSRQRRLLVLALMLVLVGAVVALIFVTQNSEDDQEATSEDTASTTSPASTAPPSSSIVSTTTAAVSTTEAPPPNGFIGRWAAIDADGSEIAIEILADGSFEAIDTSSTGCRNRDLPGGWRWEGVGSFSEGDQGPLFTATGTTYCQTSDGELSINEGVAGDFVLQPGDKLVFTADGVTYDRIGEP